jgi:glycosyltransferase involved in cell wall biosynthesis
MAPIYFDLSEQFLANGHRFKYYGIVRTVMEVGYEMARDADVRFVIFSPAHGSFFQVTPRFDDASPTGVMDPGLPPEATPIRLRQTYPTRNVLRDALFPLVRAVVRGINLKRWQHAPKEGITPVDLSGQTLIALGRPKIMADYLVALKRKGTDVRMVPLLHDMIPLHTFAHREQKIFTSNFMHDNARVIAHSDLVLANSEFTGHEIAHFAGKGLFPGLPKVVPVPLAHELRETGEPMNMTLPAQPYLLCVGTLTGRKNLECMMQAMLHLHATGQNVPDLVLAGARRKRTDEFIAKPHFTPLQSKIHQLRDPNQTELRALYKNALALVIPSYMEGWGLPLGEALWVGTPGLASTAPALLEVGQDLAWYFDPDKHEALSALITKLQADPKIQARLRQEIAAAHPQLRSWQHVAQDILHAVRTHLSAGRPDV